MRRIILKKISLCLLVLVFLVPLFLVYAKVARAATNSVIIHYHRDDGDYAKWNIWSWPKGGDGKAYPFDDEDKFGKICNVELSQAADEIGFIVRTDSWDKDVSDDRFIDTSKGTEIWVFSGQSDFSYEVPAGYEENVAYSELNLTVNYKLFWDKGYDGLNFSYSSDGEPEQTVPLADKINIKIPVTKKINFNILLNDKVIDYKDGAISTSKADENGNLEVFLMQGADKVAYSSDAFPSEKKVLKAEISDLNSIDFSLSIPNQKANDEINNAKITDSDGKDIKIKSVQDYISKDGIFKNMSDTMMAYDGIKLITSENLDLSKQYTVEFSGYGTSLAVLSNKIFDTDEFKKQMIYDGELGAIYAKEATTFKVWAPTSVSVSVNLYENGEAKGEAPLQQIPMVRGDKGVFSVKVDGDLNGKYYTYLINHGTETVETIDIYAKAAGVNGMRGMVVDLAATDPKGFRADKLPEFNNPTDAIIYEIQVRDLSMDKNSGITNKGKYLGFTETGTTNSNGDSTGLDHIKELGVTHVHLLPVFDFKTIDETTLDQNKYNWGYDPQNYDVPEGSYSTDPYHGEVRINEFKQMVQAFHENGLRVVMDVVYNHTFSADDSAFNLTVPGYYYRYNADGTYSNGSGCGNETASEREMMRKYIIDSVTYWAKEYRVDGFRFDLMALTDVDTMNQVRAALNKIDPSIIVYGEGWTGGTSTLLNSEQSLKNNMSKLDSNIAAFSDDIRDGIKGSVFNESDKGFVNSAQKLTNVRDDQIKFGIVASTKHEGIDLSKLVNTKIFWAKDPTQTITYASAHDNLTLWDKLHASNKVASDEELVAMNKLSAAIVLTSQGVPFFQAGEEMARTKKGNDNSYQAPDSINALDWNRKTQYIDLFNYYKGLIELRKKYDVFRMTLADMVQKNLSFIDTDVSLVAYTIKDDNSSDGYDKFAVIFNGSYDEKTVNIGGNAWDVLVDGTSAGTNVLQTVSGNNVTIPAKSAMVLAEKIASVSTTENTTSQNEVAADNTPSPKNNVLPFVVGGAVILAAAGVFAVFRKKSN